MESVESGKMIGSHGRVSRGEDLPLSTLEHLVSQHVVEG